MTEDKQKEGYISDQDIEYINDLLMWPYNDIYIIPTLHFETGDTTIPVDRRMAFYENFVRRLLEAKNSISEKVKPTVTIPIFYKRRDIERIFDLYKDENEEPNFIVVDFGGTRLLSPKMIGVLPRVYKHYNAIGEEKFFIYGFNVKPHKKGAEIAYAEDIGTYLSGINAIGPPHRMSRNLINITPQSLSHLPRVFNDNDYKYYSLSLHDARNILNDWSERYYDKEIYFHDPSKVPRHIITKHNIYRTGEQVSLLSTYVRNGESEMVRELIEPKELTSVVMDKLGSKILKKRRNRIPKNTKTLDIF